MITLTDYEKDVFKSMAENPFSIRNGHAESYEIASKSDKLDLRVYDNLMMIYRFWLYLPEKKEKLEIKYS